VGGDVARRWRPDEDDRLRRLYVSDAPLALIARELGRSGDAVSARRRALGIPDRRSSPAWSTLEDRLLRHAAHARLPATALAPRLGRPVEQVRVRRRRLGLARPGTRRYTAAEDALLRVEWPATRDIDALARRLGRSPDALRLRAGELGLHRPARRRRWSASEDAIVRDGYADGLTCKEIAARLSQRTPTAIAARARKLRLATYARRWTAGDDARLGRVLARRSVDDAARRLGRTPEAVRQRARKLGIAAPAAGEITRAGARWTAAEDELLVLHAALNPAVLGALLGRSDQAIAGRLRRLGVRAGRRRSPHHPSTSNGGLTPGERALVDRELRHRGLARSFHSRAASNDRLAPSRSSLSDRRRRVAHLVTGDKRGGRPWAGTDEDRPLKTTKEFDRSHEQASIKRTAARARGWCHARPLAVCAARRSGPEPADDALRSPGDLGPVDAQRLRDRGKRLAAQQHRQDGEIVVVESGGGGLVRVARDGRKHGLSRCHRSDGGEQPGHR